MLLHLWFCHVQSHLGWLRAFTCSALRTALAKGIDNIIDST